MVCLMKVVYKSHLALQFKCICKYYTEPFNNKKTRFFSLQIYYFTVFEHSTLRHKNKKPQIMRQYSSYY